MLGRYVERFLSLLFPDTCMECGVRGVLLCSACFATIPPAPQNEDPQILSVFAYKDRRAQRLVWLLKYQQGRRVAELFAPLLATYIQKVCAECAVCRVGTVVLVPMPISKRRRRMRGYNQAELIARAVAARAPSFVVRTDIVQKVRHTPQQAKTASRTERLENLAHAFRAAVPENANAECSVVIIDDVATTGASISAVRAALREVGYTHIHAVTVAH